MKRGNRGISISTYSLLLILMFSSLAYAKEGKQLAALKKQKSVNSDKYDKNNTCKKQSTELKKDEFIQKAEKLHLPFIANNGQMDERVKFYAKTFGGTAFVTKAGKIVYSLPEVKSKNPDLSILEHDQHTFLASIKDSSPKFSSDLAYIPVWRTLNQLNNTKEERIRTLVLQEEFVGAKITKFRGEEKAITQVNYFKGNNPSKWKTHVASYNTVSLGEMYDGIQLNLKAYGNNIEKLFCIKPGANPGQIQVRLKGANGLKINKDGQLEAETELGTVKFTKPVAYQEIEGKRVEVAVRYRVRNLKQVSRKPNERFSDSKLIYGFSIASSYDKTKDLIIDPLLSSTYLGGSSRDFCRPIAIGPDGNVYIAGYTASSDLPIPDDSDNYDTSSNGNQDAFVALLNNDLTNLSEITYLGGSGPGPDGIDSIIIDSNNNIYVTGFTESSDFPTTSNAYDTTHNGSRDAFVAVFNKHLTNLSASTYLGGTDSDNVFVITEGTDNNVYVIGNTSSIDFPVTIGAYNTTFSGDKDAFVAKFNKDLSNLSASTYLGGSALEFGFGIAKGSDDMIYVCGYTLSSDFPTTNNVYDISYNGNGDVFVAMFNNDLATLSASTYLGGNESDSPGSMIVDPKQNIYVAGITASSDFPTTSNAYERSYYNNNDVFVAMLNKDLTVLSASTYLGGSNFEGASSIIIDTDEDKIYVGGGTFSGDFPTTLGTYGGSRDTFITSMDRDLTTIHVSTYIGGSNTEGFSYIAADPGDNIYVAGETSSSDFPVTSSAYDASYNGNGDAFVCKLDFDASTTPAPTPALTATPTPTPTKDFVREKLIDIIDTVNILDPEKVFKNKNNQKALTNKLEAVIDLVDEDDYEGALNKLENDILKKTDGCNLADEPDSNDWIIDCDAQNDIYPLIVDAIAFLIGLL